MDMPTLYFILAILAVVVGPMISLLIAKWQIAASSKIACNQMRVSSEHVRDQIRASVDTCNKQIVAPMRQAWANNLRDLLAELTDTASEIRATDADHRNDERTNRLHLLETKVKFMLDPYEENHQRLEVLILEMIGVTLPEQASDDEYARVTREVIALSRTIIAGEWNRVREPVAAPGAVSDAQGQ